MNQQPMDANKGSVFSNIQNGIQSGLQSVSNSISSMKNNVNTSLNEFSNQTNAPSTYNFSNTIIAKFAFIILIIIVFMFLIHLGIMIISYFTMPSTNPYLIYGTTSGSTALKISQDPKDKDSIQILRSNNQSTGIEFTWSTWLFIDDLMNENANGSNSNFYQHIFNKGDNRYDPITNIATVNNGPGLYLGPGPNNNNLRIIMDTDVAEDTNNVIDISNIPLKQWVNVAIRLENTILDVYINGIITSRIVLDNVPKQNYNDVFICQNGGFSGNISDLRYFSSALNVFEINSIVKTGPNLTPAKGKAPKPSLFTYLSQRWYKLKM